MVFLPLYSDSKLLFEFFWHLPFFSLPKFFLCFLLLFYSLLPGIPIRNIHSVKLKFEKVHFLLKSFATRRNNFSCMIQENVEIIWIFRQLQNWAIQLLLSEFFLSRSLFNVIKGQILLSNFKGVSENCSNHLLFLSGLILNGK